MNDNNREQALDVSLRSLGTVAKSDQIDDELGVIVARMADPDERRLIEANRSAEPTSTRRATTTKWTIGLIAGALVVAGGAVPATAFMDWMARTGTGTESHGGELIELTAPDVDGLVNEMYPQWLPLPDSFSQSEAVESVQAILQNSVNDPIANPNGGSVVMEDVGILRGFESFALCGWIWEWRHADREGDTQAKDIASAHIRDAAAWPALVQTDGGGVTDSIRAVADDADAGNSSAVSGAYGVQLCSTLLGDTRAIRSKE